MIANDLINTGYDLADIQEMISIFQKNLTSYQKTFNNGDQENILLTLHKLKGGLKILQFSHLLCAVNDLETLIKTKGVKVNSLKLEELITSCFKTSNSILTQLQLINQ